MEEIIPKIEPLFEDLKRLNLGQFLLSQDFKRYCIKINFEESWRNAFKHAKSERRYFCVDIDHDLFDSIDALGLILNRLYQSDKDNFFGFVHDLLLIYTQWSKNDLRVKDILDDLALLSAPENIILGIEKLGNYFSTPVPKTSIPEKMWNSEKLESFLRKMDDSIKEEEYNTTLTYAYSCLEGLFKSFIVEKMPEKSELDKLNQLSVAVRDYLKGDFCSRGIEYPEQVLNLIPTITNAISTARNSFSNSHFDGESQKWLAEFARDCVNSIGRLIIKFIG